MGPWISSEHQGLLVERPSAKSHFEKNDPAQTKQSGKLDKLPKSSFLDKMASFLMPFLGPMPFFGPHGAQDHMGDWDGLDSGPAALGNAHAVHDQVTRIHLSRESSVSGYSLLGPTRVL